MLDRALFLGAEETMAVLVMNNDQIREKEAGEAESRRQAEEGAQQVFIDGLAAHIRACWQEAKQAKIPVERRILASKRQRSGEYEPAKLAAMKMLFGEDYEPEFLNITGTKCWHAEQWIREILFQPNNKPWSIEPTPSPKLPPEIEAEVEEAVYQHFVDLVIADTVASGAMPNMQGIAEGLQAHLSFIKDEVKREQLRRAREMLNKASVKVDDALIEGNWYRALDDCLPDLSTTLTAFLKGPTLRRRPISRNVYDPMTGSYTEKVETEIVAEWERVDPLDLYFAPWSRNINDGYLIERMRFEPQQLSDLIGAPGYKEEEVRAVLREYREGGLREWTTIDAEKLRAEGKDSSALYTSRLIDCLHYWGSASGQDLLEWGGEGYFEEQVDPDLEYQIAAWMIGGHIIKAMLNPDPQKTKPYFGASLEENPDSPWGLKSLPERIKSPQNICNACARAIVHNVGVASGPQVEINEDRKVIG
jgi:hypothetical protein